MAGTQGGRKALTPKQDLFCQKYVETGNMTEAYCLAYDAAGMKRGTSARKAREEAAKPLLAARIAELRGAVVAEHKVTVAGLIVELEEARQIAKREGTASAMVTATMGKAKLAGLDKAGPDDDETAAPTRVEVTIKDARADP
jgi:phage terminase small subunit